MKKILLLGFIISATVRSFGQVNYEHSYPTYSAQYSIFFITNIGFNNYKYVLYDCYSDQFSLYNLDHSPFLLNIQVPANSDSCMRFSIGFISAMLFDCDSSTIEYALLPETPIYPFQIYRTDGTLLFSKDSVYGYWCYGCQEASTEIHTIMNTPAGTKLYLHYPWSDPDSVLVYGLCGYLPQNITEINQSSSFVTVNPNPSRDQIHFEVSLPNNFKECELTVYNSSFQVLKTAKVRGIKTEINFNTEQMGSGVLFYSLQNKGKILQTGKMILSK